MGYRSIIFDKVPTACFQAVAKCLFVHPGLTTAACPHTDSVASGRDHQRECIEMADDVAPHRPRGLGGVIKAARWSCQGLKATWRHESSFRTEVYLFALLAPLALWLGRSGVERALLIGSCLLVLAAELLNSAIEALIDRYGNEWHELAGRAKDMGSAAVFVLMMNVLLVWGVILWPQLY